MTTLTGRGVAPGMAVGRARGRRPRSAAGALPPRGERRRSRAAAAAAARERTRAELEEISARVSRTVGPAQAAIFAAQLLMLDDPLLTRRADELIRTERINADWALERAIDELHEVFAREGDAWLRERVGDLADVGGRLQRNLRPGRDPLVDLVQELEPPLILVADELPPSVGRAARLDARARARLRRRQSDASHRHPGALARHARRRRPRRRDAAHHARAAAGDRRHDGRSRRRSDRRRAGALAAARGDCARRALRGARRAARPAGRSRPTACASGSTPISRSPTKSARVRDAGAEGIGLYRSEFLLDPRIRTRDEDAQIETYRALLEAMRPHAGDDPHVRRRRGAPRRPGARAAGIASDSVCAGFARRCSTTSASARRFARCSGARRPGTLRILLPFVTISEELRQARAAHRRRSRASSARHATCRSAR